MKKFILPITTILVVIAFVLTAVGTASAAPLQVNGAKGTAGLVNPIPAADGTVTWGGHGATSCPNGAHWVLSPSQGVTGAVLTVDGASYTMHQSGGGSWSADSAGTVTPSSSASVSYTGTFTGNGTMSLQLSHCLSGGSTATATIAPSPTSTTPVTTNSAKLVEEVDCVGYLVTATANPSGAAVTGYLFAAWQTGQTSVPGGTVTVIWTTGYPLTVSLPYSGFNKPEDCDATATATATVSTEPPGTEPPGTEPPSTPTATTDPGKTPTATQPPSTEPPAVTPTSTSKPPNWGWCDQLLQGRPDQKDPWKPGTACAKHLGKGGSESQWDAFWINIQIQIDNLYKPVQIMHAN